MTGSKRHDNTSAFRHVLAAACVGVLSSAAAAAPITDFTSWTLTQDPPNLLFTGSSTGTSATLTAGNGSIAAGTDIGFASVNGTTVVGSTVGNFFSPASSFALAIDYDLTAALPAGTSTSAIFIGFGIGEDATGIDSAGVTLGAVNFNGAPLLGLAAAARVNDVTQPSGPITGSAGAAGTFFVSYDQPTGNVVVGAANTPNAATPTGSSTFTGLANGWDGQDLLASFYMRSDNPNGLPAWNGTSATALFSNFRVLGGTPIAVPEPGTAALVVISGIGLWLRRRLS
jgi:hypothetical protein